jgi:antitoxin component YwqK of YwqJK toxin-antitoxin module
MKKIFLIIINIIFFKSFIHSNIIIDTIKIKQIIAKNPILKTFNFNNAVFSINNYFFFNKDSSKISFKINSTDKWNQNNNAFKGFFNGIISNDDKFIFFGDFEFSIKNNNNILVSTIGFYQNDKLEGLIRIRTPDYFISKTVYKNGLKNGISVLYYGDVMETINEISFYQNDTLHDALYSFYKSGILKESSKVVQGKKEGIYKLYYPNGKIKLEAHYSNDICKGYSTEYYNNGKIKYTGNYSGSFIQARLECDTCTNKKFIFEDVNYNKLDIINQYSSDFRKELGAIMKDCDLKKSIKIPLKIGTWLYYDENGNIQKKMQYKENGDVKK